MFFEKYYFKKVITNTQVLLTLSLINGTTNALIIALNVSALKLENKKKRCYK